MPLFGLMILHLVSDELAVLAGEIRERRPALADGAASGDVARARESKDCLEEQIVGDNGDEF